MAKLFDKRYTLTVGTPENADTPSSLVIRDLKVTFSIEKNLLGVPKPSLITVYNLSETSRNVIEEEFKKIAFTAGYKDTEALLFAGDIHKVFHRKDKENWLTDIWCSDGHFAYSKSFFNKSYADSVTNDMIIRDLARSFERVTVGTIQDVPAGRHSLYGTVFHGESRRLMDEMTRTFDLEWYIYNETVNVIGRAKCLNAETIVFNSLNGMENAPTITETGITLGTRLRPELIVGAKFRVESIGRDVRLGNYRFKDNLPTPGEGEYKIQKVLHFGDTHGNAWTSAIDGFLILK